MTAAQPAPAPGGTAPRVLVVDLLRLLATVQMVQGHVIDAVLAPQFRAGALHGAWSSVRGLTSVAFLFAAGWSFHLATLRALSRHKHDRDAVARRFRRAGMLIAFGYALHLPVGAFAGLDAEAAVRAAFAVDVLQCIGVCLALLELLALALPTRRSVELACCALGALVLGVSPLLSGFVPQGPLLPLENYLSARAGSLFPLFPWAGHMLLGAGLGGLLLGDGSASARGKRLVAAGCAGLGAAWLAARAVHPLVADHLGRLGWVLLACAALVRLEPNARRWPDWTRRLAGESLFVYAFHVLLAYGHGVGLSSLVGERLAPPAAAALAVLVLSASAACALHYERAWAGLARRTATG